MTHTRTLLLGAGLLCLGAALVRRPRPLAETRTAVAPQRSFGLADTLGRTVAGLDRELAREIVADARARARRALWERLPADPYAEGAHA